MTKSKVVTFSKIQFVITQDNIWLVRESVMDMFGYGSGDYYVSPDCKFVLDKDGKVISPVVGLVDHIELTEDIHGDAMQVHLINEAGIMQMEPSSWDCGGRTMDSFLKDEVIPELHERQKDFMEVTKMESELEVIKEQEVLGKQFRIYGTVEEPVFLAKDVAEWIDYAKTSKGAYNISMMLRTVDEDEKLVSTILISGQNREMWFLTEDGLYEALMQSRKPIAKQFKKKVKEILKEIRKTGQYVAKAMDSYMIENPIERAKAWIKEEERRIALAEKVNTLEPLAGQTMKYIEKGHLIGIRDLAKELKVNENFLRYVVDDVLGWRYRKGNGHRAYKWAITDGYMATKDFAPGRTYDYFTVKGRMRVEEKLKELSVA